MLIETQNLQAIEQIVRNIVDLGPMPMVAFGGLLQNLHVLENPMPFKARRALLVGVFTALSLFFAACEASVPISDNVRIEHVLSDYDQAQAAQQAEQEKNEPSSQTASNVEQTKSYQPDEVNGFWIRDATVEANEGVVAALTRKAGAQASELTVTPEGYMQAVIIYHDGIPVGVYSWPKLLAMDPRVDVGDRVEHRFITNETLQDLQRMGLLPANIHLN